MSDDEVVHMVSVDGDDLEAMCEIEEQLFGGVDPLFEMRLDELFDGGGDAISEG
jgi:hypothetical protein